MTFNIYGLVLCIASAVANAELSSRTSFLSSHTRRRATVKTYDPNLFTMHKDCGVAAALPDIPPMSEFPYHNKKHNVGAFFTSIMTTQVPYSESLHTKASDASLFVLPVFWVQSFDGSCGNHSAHVSQLKEVLNQSEQYRRNMGRDHVLICETPGSCNNAREHFPHMLLGGFETLPHISGNVVAVGYSTYDAIGACKRHPPLPIEKRTWKVTFVGQTVKTKPNEICEQVLEADVTQAVLGNEFDIDEEGCRDHYRRRRDLWCDWVDTSDKPKGFNIQAYQKSCNSSKEDAMLNEGRTDECGPYEDMRQSKMVLSLRGDTPTTDRIFNAFNTLTPIAVLSDEKAEIIAELPARQVVPWDDILIEVDSKEFMEAPVRALEGLVHQTSDDSLRAVQTLMKKYGPDVLWHIDGSRAPKHFLHRAQLLLGI